MNYFIIAKNTFRQAIRDKILYGILIFALLFIGLTVILSSMSLGEDIFIIRNFGLAGIYIFGLVITIFLGASAVYEEVEKKSTYFLLSKPVTRTDIILGNFLGLLSALSLTTLLMLGAYFLIVMLSGGGLDYMAFWAILLQIFEMAILVSFLILFSVFTTPLAATIYTIMILYSGHLMSFLQEFYLKSEGLTRYFLMSVYYFFPNLEKFNVRNLIVHQIPISPETLVSSIAYAIAYIVLILLLARTLLNLKEL